MQEYYRKFEKLFFFCMFKSGIGTGVCWIGALGFGNKRHKRGGSLRVARPIDLAKPMKHGMVALHNVSKNYDHVLIFIKFYTVIYNKSLIIGDILCNL